jgi:hypothetical protein
MANVAAQFPGYTDAVDNPMLTSPTSVMGLILGYAGDSLVISPPDGAVELLRRRSALRVDQWPKSH